MNFKIEGKTKMKSFSADDKSNITEPSTIALIWLR